MELFVMAVKNYSHINQPSQRGAPVDVINLFHFFKGAPELNKQGCWRLPSKLHKSAPAAISSD